MTMHTDFLPAERLTLPEILDQSEQVRESDVLIAMLDSSGDMMALLNPERQVVLCNAACVKAAGLADKQEALGMRPGELLHCVHANDQPGGCGTSASCRYCGLAQALVAGQKGRANSGECLLQCFDNHYESSTEYAVEVRPLPRIGEGWQCYSLKDISGEKRREALEHIFFHDIMNRASAVEGVSEMLIEGDCSQEESAELMRMLSTSARALVEDVRSQRTLLAAERRELAVNVTACDSLAAVRDAVAACRAFGFAENKQVQIQPDAQSITFHTDISLLGRVLVNMLKNALEASAARSTVTITCVKSDWGCIRFSVHNDTVMPAVVRAHVFQRSFSTKGAGRGLGTYSVKLLTENYLGGKASFESAPGQGTTFTVEFAG